MLANRPTDPALPQIQRPTRRHLLVAAAACSVAVPARAQRFPARPLTIVVPFGPGGIADLTARAVAEALARSLGQAVVVENKPSAGAIVGTQAVASAKPDGHTLLLLSNANAVAVSLFRKLPYDVTKDLVPVSTIGSFDLALFVAQGSRFASLRDLLAFAKANPGKLNLATIAVGSTQHLAAKLFETLAGVSLLVVPYKASPAVLGALRGGEVDAAFEIVAPMLPQVAAGAVRALAVSAARRSGVLPDAPTMQEAGVAGYDVASWNALAVPAGTPAEVVQQLERAVHEAVASPAVQERLGKLGMRLGASTPVAAGALLESEIKRWAGVIRAARIEPE